MRLELIFKSTHQLRCYGNIHVCIIHYKGIAAEREMLAGDCVRSTGWLNHHLHSRLRVEESMRHGTGQRVDDEANEADEQHDEQYFEDEPLVVLPDDVLERLERVHEPQERRVRTTTSEHNIHTYTFICSNDNKNQWQ